MPSHEGRSDSKRLHSAKSRHWFRVNSALARIAGIDGDVIFIHLALCARFPIQQRGGLSV